MTAEFAVDPEFPAENAQRQALPRLLVLGSSLFGLLLAITLSANSGSLWLDLEDASSTIVGALAFTLILAVPFLLGVASVSPGPLELRRAILAGASCGALVLAILGIFSVGAIYLIIAAVWLGSLWISRNQVGAPLRSVTLSTWISLNMIVAAVAFVGDRESACWDGNAWIERPNGSTVGGPTGFSSCTTGFVDNRSGSVALLAAFLALSLPLLFLVRERRSA